MTDWGSLLVSYRYLVGGYLSAEAVVNMFSKAVMETVNWPVISSTLDCLVRPVLGGPDLRLEIRCVSVLVCCLSVCRHQLTEILCCFVFFCCVLGLEVKKRLKAAISPCSFRCCPS